MHMVFAGVKIEGKLMLIIVRMLQLGGSTTVQAVSEHCKDYNEVQTNYCNSHHPARQA